MSRTILFTAQRDESVGDDGSLIPTDPSMPHSEVTLQKHVERKSKSVKERLKSPYISCSREITAPLMKFSYGKPRSQVKSDDDQIRFKVNRNDVRTRIFMVLVEDLPEAKSLDEDPDETTVFRQEVFGDVITGQYKNASRADQEDLIYGQVDSSHVFEIHPMLADILFMITTRIQALKVQYKSHGGPKLDEAEKLYQQILSKIMSGEYSIENFDKILEEFKINEAEQVFIDEFYGERTNVADACERAIPQMKVPEDDCERDYALVLAGTCLRNQVLKDIIPQLLARDFSDLDVDLSYLRMPSEEDVHSTTLRSTTEYYGDYAPGYYMVVPYQLSMGEFIADRHKQTLKKQQTRPFPEGVEFECDDSGRVVYARIVYSEIAKTDERPPMSQGIQRDLIWKDEEYYASKIYESDDLSHSNARNERLSYIRSRESELAGTEDLSNFIRKIEGSNGQYATFDEEGYCIIIEKRPRKDGRGSMWDIVDYMRDDEGRRTKFDRNGRGTDVNGCDRSGANRWGLPSGLSIESISGMEQEEIDERMMEVMEQFIEAPGDQLQFDASPAERMLRTYISYKAEPDMTEDKVYERMIYRVFGERITTITDREKDAIKKLMKATIRVAKEMGEDVRGITEQGVKEKQAEVDERIRIASNLSTKAKQALEQGIKVEKIITDMENDFEEEIDGK